jgi:hypothetical protein
MKKDCLSLCELFDTTFCAIFGISVSGFSMNIAFARQRRPPLLGGSLSNTLSRNRCFHQRLKRLLVPNIEQTSMPNNSQSDNPACFGRRLSMSAASVRTSGRRDNLPLFPIEAGNKGESGSFSNPVVLRYWSRSSSSLWCTGSSFSLPPFSLNRSWITSVDVFKGTLDESLAHPREIFRPVIVHAAASFVLVHNHLSGDARPSAADVRLTQRVVKGARILQVGFLDHVIVGRRIRKHPGYFSFQEAGLL